ncbi:MAG: serpin family protein [Lachnospiraceae bacterium]|nr:serpin family protein [Lachnospiraceae bacterium]
MRKLTAILLTIVIAVSICACGTVEKDDREKKKNGATKELTEGMASGSSQSKTPDEAFLEAYAAFSLGLMKECRKNGYSFVSPYSAYAALSMVVNGADGQTLSEMLTLLGLPEDGLNAYMLALADRYNEEGEVSVANSVWMNKPFEEDVKESFLKSVVDYYRASVFSADFTNPNTVGEMNRWVEQKTKNRIHELITQLDPMGTMTLINCLTFDGIWSDPFKEDNTKEADFHNEDGTVKKVQMMKGEAENYFTGKNYTGIEKYYENGYCFRAYLPNEGTTANELLNSLTEEQLVKPGTFDGKAYLSMPKFKFESDAMDLIPVLSALGMRTAFTPGADFSRMMKTSSVLISEVIQKTYIEVDEEGTKAAAATEVGMKCYAVAPQPVEHIVSLDRPFVYAIVDELTGAPLFIGIYE